MPDTEDSSDSELVLELKALKRPHTLHLVPLDCVLEIVKRHENARSERVKKWEATQALRVQRAKTPAVKKSAKAVSA